MKKNIFVALFLILSFPFFSQNFYKADYSQKSSETFNWYGSGKPFELSYAVDIPLITAGLGINASTFIYSKFFNEPLPLPLSPLDKTKLNPLDQAFAHPFNNSTDLLADVIMYGLGISPIMYLTAPQEDWLCIATMYGETLAITRGLKDVFKYSNKRARPYMYFENPPQKEIDANDWDLSFPSGHTACTFATAAFSAYMANVYFDNPYLKWSVIGGSFALAITDGVLRIYGGCHFPTDVLTGALIGTATGLFIPWLHTITSNANCPVTITPLGFNVNIQF